MCNSSSFPHTIHFALVYILPVFESLDYSSLYTIFLKEVLGAFTSCKIDVTIFSLLFFDVLRRVSLYCFLL